MLWRAPARRYPVLAIRDFRILLADRLLAPFSVGFSMVGVSFAVLNLTGSTADLSYVLAAQIAPMLVFSLISGVFADRFKPQWVIVAANACIVARRGHVRRAGADRAPGAVGDDRPGDAERHRHRAVLPASQALLPQLVPDALLQEASSISRLAMNTGQMTGAAVAGLVVAAAGPGWALTLCAIGMTGTIPLMFQVKGNVRPVRDVAQQPNMISELREGWTEFRSHTWLWATVIQFCLVMMAFNGGDHRARPGGGQGSPRRACRVGRDHRRRRVRPDRGRPDIAAVHPAQAHAVRGADRRHDGDIAARARARAAAARDLLRRASASGRLSR